MIFFAVYYKPFPLAPTAHVLNLLDKSHISAISGMKASMHAYTEQKYAEMSIWRPSVVIIL